MRTRPPASLTWLLAALLGLLPVHAAHGATLAWSTLPQGEELVFRFESALPAAEPRQRGLTQIQVPIPWSFWQRERKPKIPDFSSSRLLKEIAITPDGLFIRTHSDDFIFSFSTNPGRKELRIQLFPPPAEQATGGDGPERLEAAEGNVTDDATGLSPQDHAADTPAGTEPENAEISESPTLSEANASLPGSDGSDPAGQGSPQPAPDHGFEPDASGSHEPALSGLATVRSRIARPGQADPVPTDDSAQSALRMPIDRQATAPQQPPAQPGATAFQADDEPAPAQPPVQEAADAAPNATQAATTELPDEPAAARPVRPEETTGPEPGQSAEPDADAPEIAAPDRPDLTAEPAETTPESQARPEPEPHQQAAEEFTDQTAAAPAQAPDGNSTAELEELYSTAQTALMSGDLQAGRAAVETMLRHPGTSETLREELFYTLADITFKENVHDLEGNFLAVLEAYETAKNVNPTSRNVPEALSRLGYLHIFVGNVPEAKGHFDLLRRKYPDDPRVAMIDYYWGEHYLRRKDYVRAAEHFQYAIQNFPMSLAVQPSHVGLLKAFTALGYFEKAMEIVNSIERRWPRHYLSDPSFLMAAGYAAMLGGSQDRAKDYFWAYANIVPDAQDVDVAMARIGDILLKQGRIDAAREIYHRTAAAHPSREGGLIAKMRLAEEGVLDQPSIADMDPVFSRPAANPEEIYTSILEHADSPLAPVARLKLAMWHLWNKKYDATLDEIRRFQTAHPEHELLPKAREVADAALRDWIAESLEQGDYQGAAQHWDAHGGLYQGREPDPKLRLMVATALMQSDRPQEALDMARPFVFDSIPRGEFSEPGLDLTLALQVDLQRWTDIIDLAGRVQSWNLDPERRRQVDYATALAHEKLDRPGSAKPLWAKLATDMDLTGTQRGYAHYFLGREALAAGRLEQAGILGQEALTLLRKDGSDIPKIKETLELLAQAAERGERFQDALAWTLEYDDYVQESDPDWPAHTFRKALLFKRNSETRKWRDSLNRLKELFPDSLHGRMAAAELEGTRIEREVQKFR